MTGDGFDIVTTREPREYTFLTGIDGKVGVVEGCFAVNGVTIIFPLGSADLAADRRSFSTTESDTSSAVTPPSWALPFDSNLSRT